MKRSQTSENYARDGVAQATARADARGGEAPEAPAPGHEAVACRAYEIYLERGAEAGREVDDWFRAEAELRSAR